MDPSASSPTNPSKNFIVIGLGVIAVFLLIAAGYFIYQNQKLSTELTVLKNTDLAKDLELTQFKLKTAERDLAVFQKEVVSLKAELKTLKFAVSKINLHLDAIDQIERMVGNGPDQSAIDLVGPKIVALQNPAISKAWEEAKRGIDVVRKSWQGTLISDTVIAITSTMRSFLAQ